MSKPHSKINRKEYGATVIELLVAAAVLSVAVAGISELLWFNTSWTSKFFNKTGANFLAQKLTTMLKRDIDTSFSVDGSSNANKLILNRHSLFDSSGFPLSSGTEQITYTVSPDADTTAKRFQITRTVVSSSKISSVVVLKNISGPISPSDSSVAQIFQYIPKQVDDSDIQFGVRSDGSEGVGSIVLNVEIPNRDMGKSRSGEVNTSEVPDVGFRTEFFTRSETSSL